MMKPFLVLSFLPLLTSTSPIVIGTIHKDAAPILSAENAKEIPNSYIVVFKDHVTEDDAKDHHTWVQDLHFQTENMKIELRKRSGFQLPAVIFEGLKHTYNIAGDYLGYSGHFDDDVIEQIRSHPDVSNAWLSLYFITQVLYHLHVHVVSFTPTIITLMASMWSYLDHIWGLPSYYSLTRMRMSSRNHGTWCHRLSPNVTGYM
jgi:hypothetical protein